MFLEDLIIDDVYDSAYEAVDLSTQEYANEMCYYYGLEYVDVATEGVGEVLMGALKTVGGWIMQFLKWIGSLFARLGRWIASLFNKDTGDTIELEPEAVDAVQEVPKIYNAVSTDIEKCTKFQQNIQKLLASGIEITDEHVENAKAELDSMKENTQEATDKLATLNADIDRARKATKSHGKTKVKKQNIIQMAKAFERKQPEIKAAAQRHVDTLKKTVEVSNARLEEKMKSEGKSESQIKAQQLINTAQQATACEQKLLTQLGGCAALMNKAVAQQEAAEKRVDNAVKKVESPEYKEALTRFTTEYKETASKYAAFPDNQVKPILNQLKITDAGAWKPAVALSGPQVVELKIKSNPSDRDKDMLKIVDFVMGKMKDKQIGKTVIQLAKKGMTAEKDLNKAKRFEDNVASHGAGLFVAHNTMTS